MALTPKFIQRWVKKHPDLTAAERKIAKEAMLSCAIAKIKPVSQSKGLRAAVIADLQAFADLAKRHR